MNNPHMALQDAVLIALLASESLAVSTDQQVGSVGGRVYDEPPPKETFPYVTIGDGQTVPDKAGCIDGAENFIDVHVWSRRPGWVEAKALAWKVKEALDDVDLAVEGHRLIDLQYQSAQYLRDPDGLTRHAVVTFRAVTEPTS